MSDDTAIGRMSAADAFDALLRERAGEHPDVEVYTRIRERSRRALSQLWDPQSITPEAMEWAVKTLGGDDSEGSYRARAHAIVDAITGRTPEAAARVAEVAVAERAALAWLREVTVHELTAEVARRLHETSVRHVAGIGYGTPAVALVQAAVGILADTARAAGGA